MESLLSERVLVSMAALFIVGVAGIVRGAALISPAAGWITFGVLTATVAVWPLVRKGGR